jgi:hypothetical protein
MRRILSALLLLFIFVPFSCAGNRSKKTERHQAAHLIIMVTRDDSGAIEEAGGCSATAIGPHTLLTAAHCYLPGETLYIDSPAADVKSGVAFGFHPTDADFISDHEDHMLIDVPGAHFTAYIPLKNFRVPRQGEKYYLFGNPGGIADQYREGYVTGKVIISAEDKGGIDAKSNTLYLLVGPVVGGDSGSSIYAKNGQLIGIVTFATGDGAFIGMFPIEFTAGQIAKSLL